ncbi:MET1 [Candida pseudojiufengensis]|uniref:MET1 n=1 Tax=Candida pseudojiufengensis TaxID=497109 RepID=UPI00222583CD|nr:MET1 [Candida pseudojiufengensis]KAI5960181.1 MET1 [Candida pseudojiufengensis]
MTNLLASLNIRNERILLVGYSNLTILRINSILECNGYPILLIPNTDNISEIIKQYEEEKKLQIVIDPEFDINIRKHLTSLGKEYTDFIVDKVFVTLLQSSQHQIRENIYRECKKLRIPINTTDEPELCTFTLLSTYKQGDFQLGITTNGKGCKLSSRLKREIINKLPTDLDKICDNIGNLRNQIQIEDNIKELIPGENEDDLNNLKNFNSLVKEFNQSKDDIKLRRNRWLSQIVEYYPLSKLSNISIDDLKLVYKDDKLSSPTIEKDTTKKGKIALIGSGPGSISLLTIGALQAINKAELILADKLVPQQVLDLIPKNHGPEIFIARKFPGNAEKAQEELLEIGLNALIQGKFVIRLKQGDPYIFGRGGEEFNFFQTHGFKPIVIPGISSALAAPVVANIPMTHRDVADQVLICTGTGRKGIIPNLPLFESNRTTIFLMALHRIIELIPVLINDKNWPSNLPVAIIEKASCPDQRIIRTTLSKLDKVVEIFGSRPPGLLVTGYACEVIHKNSELKDWIIEEGFNYEFDNSKISVL